MKRIIAVSALLFLGDVAFAQQTNPVTLSSLYEQLEVNYPVANKAENQRKITEVQQKLSQTGWFPEITLGASASFQSEVTEVAFVPTMPEFSKDHYTLSVDVTQPLYEAGRVAKMKQLNSVQGEVVEAGFEIEMNNIRSQVDRVFFGILNAQKQLDILNVLIENLEEQLRRMKVLVQNEVQLPSNQYVIEAEILKVKQQIIVVKSSIESGLDALEILTGQRVSDHSVLKPPAIVEGIESEMIRPEYELFRLQQKTLATQLDLSNSDKLPVVSAFGKTAYGRPGFNAFDDDLHAYWIVGVKAQWSFRNWRNTGKKSQVFEMQKHQIKADEEAFSVQLETAIAKQRSAIEALNDQLKLDAEVLNLRTKVVAEKQYKLEEGVITSTEFITELNAQNRATLDFELHKLQQVQANYELQRLQGKI